MGRMGQHILKRRLRVQLPAFREQLIKETNHAMKADLDSHGLGSGVSSPRRWINWMETLTKDIIDAWKEVLIASTFTNIFMRLNNLVLFGKELGQSSCDNYTVRLVVLTRVGGQRMKAASLRWS